MQLNPWEACSFLNRNWGVDGKVLGAGRLEWKE